MLLGGLYLVTSMESSVRSIFQVEGKRESEQAKEEQLFVFKSFSSFSLLQILEKKVNNTTYKKFKA